MKILGVIGNGQAGGVVADSFYAKGVKSVAINYSQRDLDALTNLPKENKLCNIGSEGVGKDRQRAKDLMADNWEMNTNFIKQHFSHPSIEIILIPFATAGGSGSGISPLLIEFLTNLMPDKVFVACPILPDTEEVVVNQINSMNTLNDFGEMDVAILPIDNGKVKSSSKSKLYEEINKRFVSDISNLINCTDKANNAGNLDKKDLVQIFNTPGFMSIGKTDISKLDKDIDLTKEGISQLVNESWDESIYANIDKSKITRAGIIFDGQQSMLDFIDHTHLFASFSNYPVDLFEGVFSESQGLLTTILAGLSWPKDRLGEIESLITDKEASIDMALAKSSYKSKINSKQINQKIRSTKKKIKSASEILKQYQ